MASDPVFNCTKVQFPTDRLTVGDLRRLFPEHFDSETPDYVVFFPLEGEPPKGSVAFSDMLHHERRLAQIAFEDALIAAKGVADTPVAQRWLEEERREKTAILESAYQQFGLASGPEAARLMIRQFFQDAAAQVSGLGKGRFT
jgi:hypothetical protein